MQTWITVQTYPIENGDSVTRIGWLPLLIQLRNQLHFSKKAMDFAANGHLEILKWLRDNQTEGCSTDAMDNAAKYGHLEVLQWLYYN
jgi:hypothetical protein